MADQLRDVPVTAAPYKLKVPRERSFLCGQDLLATLFDGWYSVPKIEPLGGSWEQELRGLLARQRGRRDPTVVRGEVVSRMAFEIATGDVDRLLALIAAEVKL